MRIPLLASAQAVLESQVPQSTRLKLRAHRIFGMRDRRWLIESLLAASTPDKPAAGQTAPPVTVFELQSPLQSPGSGIHVSHACVRTAIDALAPPGSLSSVLAELERASGSPLETPDPSSSTTVDSGVAGGLAAVAAMAASRPSSAVHVVGAAPCDDVTLSTLLSAPLARLRPPSLSERVAVLEGFVACTSCHRSQGGADEAAPAEQDDTLATPEPPLPVSSASLLPSDAASSDSQSLVALELLAACLGPSPESLLELLAEASSLGHGRSREASDGPAARLTALETAAAAIRGRVSSQLRQALALPAADARGICGPEGDEGEGRKTVLLWAALSAVVGAGELVARPALSGLGEAVEAGSAGGLTGSGERLSPRALDAMDEAVGTEQAAAELGSAAQARCKAGLGAVITVLLQALGRPEDDAAALDAVSALQGFVADGWLTLSQDADAAATDEEGGINASLLPSSQGVAVILRSWLGPAFLEVLEDQEAMTEMRRRAKAVLTAADIEAAIAQLEELQAESRAAIVALADVNARLEAARQACGRAGANQHEQTEVERTRMACIEILSFRDGVLSGLRELSRRVEVMKATSDDLPGAVEALEQIRAGSDACEQELLHQPTGVRQ